MERFNIGYYLEGGDWPIFMLGGKKRVAADNYGDAECPFCDHVAIQEGSDFWLGDKCYNCGAKVSRVVV
jgi:hypothetical protein